MANKLRASRGSWFRAGGDQGTASRANLDKLLQPHERKALANWHWEIWGRDDQLPPPGDWRVWLICAGRGFGKTRAGAEWVRDVARHDPEARIALAGDCYLVTAPSSGAFAGHDDRLAGWDGQQWTFSDPVEGMRLYDQSNGSSLIYKSGWQRAAAPIDPTGGTTIDT